jgi:hypothetical protein
MNAAALLDRLERVRQTGPNRWMSACPAHTDKSPSLSIRETDDGRILLHDFAGCDVHSVLAALGLSLSDLFPDRLEHHVKPTRSRVPLRDLVAMLDHEALVIYLAGSDLLEKKTIDAEDWQRLKLAVRRVGEVRDDLT